MKKYSLKHLIITGIICSVISSGIGVTAITLTADKVTYTPEDSEFNVQNVDEAINLLYNLANENNGKMRLSFKLYGNYVINVEGDVFGTGVSGRVVVDIEDGKIISTTGTSLSGKDTDTYHSNILNASVSDFKIETE